MAIVTRYVYAAMCPWKDSFEVAGIFKGIKSTVSGYGIGIMPVYETLDALREDFPEGDVYVMEFQTKDEVNPCTQS